MLATGWIGRLDQVTHFLSIVGADRDDQGRFKIWDGGVASFMGDTRDDADCVIGADACYSLAGRKVSLAAGLASTSYGCAITVF